MAELAFKIQIKFSAPPNGHHRSPLALAYSEQRLILSTGSIAGLFRALTPLLIT